MFEEQTQKLYDSFIDRLNNLFSKKPFLATLVVSIVVSLLITSFLSDYKGGEAKIVTGNNGVTEFNLESGLGGTDNTPKKLKVDLAGAINIPGVYELPVGSRLQDVLAMGGGFVDEVSSLWVSKNLNLSQIVNDGEKVYIPFEWDLVGLTEEGGPEVKVLNMGVISGSKQQKAVANVIKEITGSIAASGLQSSQSNSSADTIGFVSGTSYGSASTGFLEGASGSFVSNLVNVNIASSAELDKLPGIGPAFAGRIIENRPYVDFSEFKDKSGLSANLAESLKGLISF